MAVSPWKAAGCLLAIPASMLIAFSQAQASETGIGGQNRGDVGLSARPIEIAMGSVSSANGAASSAISAHALQRTAEPKVWMLVGIGVFLIGAVSHRRISSTGS